MYFLIISYGIISFFYSKMFLLFSEAAMKLFSVPLMIMLEGVVYFKAGNFCGLLLSIIHMPIRKFMMIVLYMMFMVNTLLLLRIYHIYNFHLTDITFFYLFRLLTGINVTILLSLYAQFIARFAPTTQYHNKFTAILFNNSVFVLPVWNLMYHYLNINSIFTILNLLIFSNILYFIINKKQINLFVENGQQQMHQVLYPKIFMNKDIMSKTYKIYVKCCLFIATLLFFLMVILLLNTKITMTQVNQPQLVRLLFENIPYLLSIVIFLLHKYIKPHWLFILIIFLGCINFAANLSLLILVNTGLIYGLYLLLTTVFIAKIKEATKSLFYYGSLIFYIFKTVVVGLLMKIFSKKLASYMLFSPTYYKLYFVIIMTLLFICYMKFFSQKTQA